MTSIGASGRFVCKGGGFETSDMSVSLVTEVGTVVDEARLMDLGLSASKDSILLPVI